MGRGRRTILLLVTPYLVFTLDTTIGSIQLDEDDIIDNFLQKHPLVIMPIDERPEEFLGKPEKNPWAEVFTTNYDQDHANLWKLVHPKL